MNFKFKNSRKQYHEIFVALSLYFQKQKKIKPEIPLNKILMSERMHNKLSEIGAKKVDARTICR